MGEGKGQKVRRGERESQENSPLSTGSQDHDISQNQQSDA